jgi:hypothetical protein
MTRQEHSLSFAEALEEEYRSLFGKFEHETITFERRHVREIDHLRKRLELLEKDDAPSRLHLLAEYLPSQIAAGSGQDQSVVAVSDPNERVLEAFRRMLADPELLDKLLKAHSRTVQEVTQSTVWRALSRVPGARVHLLKQRQLADHVVRDELLIRRLASRSAAIRLLLHDGFRRAFEIYPALLSTVADNEALAQVIVDDPARRRRLVAKFVPSRPEGLFDRFRERGPRWLRPRAVTFRDPGLEKLAVSAADVADVADPKLEIDTTTPCSDERLARFNAVIIE